jgi:hypothetical protein
LGPGRYAGQALGEVPTGEVWQCLLHSTIGIKGKFKSLAGCQKYIFGQEYLKVMHEVSKAALCLPDWWSWVSKSNIL